MESNRQTTLILGILLTILGIVVLGALMFTTLVTVFVLGLALIIGGVLEIAHAFYRERRGSTFYEIIGGIINLIVGGVMVFFPAISALSLALIIAVALIILGIYRIVIGFSSRAVNRGWSVFVGFVTLLLGIMVFIGWPATGLFIIGLFLGVQLLISGISLLLMRPNLPLVEIERGISYTHEVKKPRSKEKQD